MRATISSIGELVFSLVFFSGALIVNSIRRISGELYYSEEEFHPLNPIDYSLLETLDYGTKEFGQGLRRIDEWSRGWILDIALSLLIFGILYLILRVICEEFSIYI